MLVSLELQNHHISYSLLRWLRPRSRGVDKDSQVETSEFKVHNVNAEPLIEEPLLEGWTGSLCGHGREVAILQCTICFCVLPRKTTKGQFGFPRLKVHFSSFCFYYFMNVVWERAVLRNVLILEGIKSLQMRLVKS